MRLAAMILLLAGISAAQELKYGIKAGIPFTDSVSTKPTPNVQFSDIGKRFGIGPTVEYWMNQRLGISLDALYRRISFESSRALDTPELQLATSKTTGHSLEFPVQGKFRFWRNRWDNVRPFAGAGMSFRVYSGVEQERTQLVDGLPATVIIEDPPILENQWSPGFVFSGGVDVGDEAYQIRPEFRYTVWTRNQFQSPVGEFESTQNQFEFLISLVF